MIRTALVLSLLAAPAFAEDSDHLSEKDGVRILHAWTRATSDHDGALFFEVENTSGKEVVLLGAESDAAKDVHIVTSSIKAGGAAEEVESFPIAAGSEFEFTPNGVFLELHDMKSPLVEGEEFEVHLVFQDIGEIEAHVEIEAADADGHAHAGHNH